MRELERDPPADAAPDAGPPSFARLVVVGRGRAGGAIARAAAAIASNLLVALEESAAEAAEARA